MAFQPFKYPNWENIAFIIIGKLLVGNNPFFSRSELMRSDDLTYFVNEFSQIFSHKKKPTHPENTLQRTIQNLRDQGFIEFLGKGEYKLTQKGFDRLNDPEFTKFKNIYELNLKQPKSNSNL